LTFDRCSLWEKTALVVRRAVVYYLVISHYLYGS
jgi:hypothetical protein